jgi:hypothetical protein
LFVNIVGFNAVEALLMFLFVIKFKIRDYEKLDLLICLTSVTILNYTITKFIGLPVISQCLLFIFSGFIINKVLEIDIKKSIIGFVYIIFIMILVEGTFANMYNAFLGINLMNVINLNTKFVYFIPIRITEFLTSFLIARSIFGGGNHNESLVGKATKKRKN